MIEAKLFPKGHIMMHTADIIEIELLKCIGFYYSVLIIWHFMLVKHAD